MSLQIIPFEIVPTDSRYFSGRAVLAVAAAIAAITFILVVIILS